MSKFIKGFRAKGERNINEITKERSNVFYDILEIPSKLQGWIVDRVGHNFRISLKKKNRRTCNLD